jgi:hypothetical protein
MFKAIKRAMSRIKDVILRVPSDKALVKCFKEDFAGVENPVKSIKYSQEKVKTELRLDAAELERFILEQEQAVKEASKVLSSLKKEVPEFKEYVRKPSKKRPKFKIKSNKKECPSFSEPVPEVESGNNTSAAPETKELAEKLRKEGMNATTYTRSATEERPKFNCGKGK